MFASSKYALIPPKGHFASSIETADLAGLLLEPHAVESARLEFLFLIDDSISAHFALQKMTLGLTSEYVLLALELDALGLAHYESHSTHNVRLKSNR